MKEKCFDAIWVSLALSLSLYVCARDVSDHLEGVDRKSIAVTGAFWPFVIKHFRRADV